MGTSNDVLMFAASGSGAMDASVSNLFSRGDKVIVCTAGKFGERWVDIAKAYGLDATVLSVPYGEVVTPAQVEAALAAEPGRARRVRAGLGNLHRRRARRAGDGPRGGQNRCHLYCGRHHRPGHHAARYRRLGPRRGGGRLPEGLYDPARPGVCLHQPQGVEVRRNRRPAALLLQFQEGKEERRRGRIQLDPLHRPDSGAGRSAAVREPDRHGQPGGERPTARAAPPAPRS